MYRSTVLGPNYSLKGKITAMGAVMHLELEFTKERNINRV